MLCRSHIFLSHGDSSYAKPARNIFAAMKHRFQHLDCSLTKWSNSRVLYSAHLKLDLQLLLYLLLGRPNRSSKTPFVQISTKLKIILIYKAFIKHVNMQAFKVNIAGYFGIVYVFASVLTRSLTSTAATVSLEMRLYREICPILLTKIDSLPTKIWRMYFGKTFSAGCYSLYSILLYLAVLKKNLGYALKENDTPLEEGYARGRMNAHTKILDGYRTFRSLTIR